MKGWRGCQVMMMFAALAYTGCGQLAGEAPPRSPQVGITVSDTTAPPGVSVPGARWIRIRGAGGVSTNEQLAAVFRPSGPGPFPLVIELHGSGGLKDVDVEWAALLAQSGFIALAGCWQGSTVPPNTFQFYELTVTFIACPGFAATDIDAVDALITAGRKQPGAKSDAIAMYGMSAGGFAALEVAAARHDISAAVLDSPAVQDAPKPSAINCPVLVLAGTADEYVDFGLQKGYVDELRAAGKPVEWHYYQGGRHTLILDPANKNDAVQRIVEFLARRLNVS